MQQINPLLKQIGQLINARFQTFETVIKAEINAVVSASEKRVTKNLREEIKTAVKASEERVTKNLRVVIKASEERVTKKIQIMEDKLDGKIHNHEARITRIEEHTTIPS